MVDLGSSTVKAGYAGEDTPKAVFPSTVGWLDKDPEAAGKKDGGDGEVKGVLRRPANVRERPQHASEQSDRTLPTIKLG